jgi:hypothetical protein
MSEVIVEVSVFLAKLIAYDFTVLVEDIFGARHD